MRQETSPIVSLREAQQTALGQGWDQMQGQAERQGLDQGRPATTHEWDNSSPEPES